MTLNQRAEIVPALYRLQAELNVLKMHCADAQALVIGVKVQAAQSSITDALAECQPDAPVSPQIEFPRSKF